MSFRKCSVWSLYLKKVGVNIFLKKEIIKIIFLPQIPNLSLHSDHNQNWGKGGGFKHILVA